MAQNYFQRLQAENAALRERIGAMEQMIAEFRAHLASPKFHDDTTIQVRDVDARLIALWHATVEG